MNNPHRLATLYGKDINISQGTQFPLSHDSYQQPQTYVKPEAAITVYELLMMSGVSLETC
jgi:hypothetical protein